MRGRKESTKQEAARTLLSISASTIIDGTKDIVGTEDITSVVKVDARDVMLKEGSFYICYLNFHFHSHVYTEHTLLCYSPY